MKLPQSKVFHRLPVLHQQVSSTQRPGPAPDQAGPACSGPDYGREDGRRAPVPEPERVLRNSGYHEAAWRVSAPDPASVLGLRHYVDLARTAERGVLDSIFLPGSPGMAEFRSEYLPCAAGQVPVHRNSSSVASSRKPPT